MKKDQKFYIQVELVPEYPECPFCGGKVKIKDHSRYKYNHMDIAGIPSVIDFDPSFLSFFKDYHHRLQDLMGKVTHPMCFLAS